MSKKNEHGVEIFFRKAANQSDTSFMAEDWQKMEKMLDDRFATELALKKRRVKRTVVSAITLGVFLFSWYYISFRSGETLVGGETIPDQKQAALVPKQDVHPKNPTADLLFQNENGDDEVYERQGAEGDEIQQAPKKTATREVSVLGQRNDTYFYTSADQVDPLETHDLVVIKKQDELSNKNVVERASTNRGMLDEIFAESKIVEDSTHTGEKEVKMAEDAEETLTQEGEMPAASRWSVNLSVAPEFSTTALSRYSAPGTSVGLMIGYHFGKRFIVHTGASYSFKRYEGYGDEYQPPNGYWERRTNGIVPDEIQGRCQILEIPLVLQFVMKHSTRSRIYLSAGLSSYVMLDEKYDYDFTTPNPGSAEGWSSDGSTSYPWAIGGFSIGYDKQLSPAFSMGIEPFLKVPFGKIGWSNITLYSTGFNVNMRYRFVKRPTSN